MLRLTLVLVAAILIAMAVAGRGTPPERLARGPALPEPAAAPTPPVREAAAGAALPAAADGLLESPALAGPAAAAPTPAPVEAKAAPEPPPPSFGSVQDELAAITGAAAPGAAGTGPAAAGLQAEIEAALAGAQRRYVNAEQVNMRAGPSTAFEVVERLGEGTEVELLDDPADGWAHVRLASPPVEGYISARYLSEVNPRP